MSPQRRRWLQHLAGAAVAPWAAAAPMPDAAGTPAGPLPAADPDPVRRGRPLVFPRDHGAHPGVRTEWWYATGWLGPAATPVLGFQLTFFRSRTGLAEGLPGRFAARQLLFAHAAVTQLPAPGRAAAHHHAQRTARWTGDPAAPLAAAAVHDGAVHIGDWQLRREGPAWHGRLPARDFALDLRLQRTQPLLLQGDAGFSRKGPQERQASHYYSEPQLAVAGTVTVNGRAHAARAEEGARAWLDQEWSEELLHPDAVGWDWIGINLLDGSALTAFQLRRADGRALWAGGSWRRPGEAAQSFAPDALRFAAGRRWTSPATRAVYPVEWQLQTPAGRYAVRALADAQELDSQGSTGAIYWEGLSELLDAAGRRVGLGYLEMTGYAGALRL
jgi:predicted secreted hydrolase